MGIRRQFQPRIDEFVADLRTFATGAYLRDSERELWDPPFEAHAAEEVGGVLEGLADGLDHLGTSASSKQIAARITDAITELLKINSAHLDAILEPEEFVEINRLFSDMGRAAGADPGITLPQLE